MKILTTVLTALLTKMVMGGEWVSLSEREDFSAWKGGEGKTSLAGYTLKDGVITAMEKPKNLISAKEYEDYILEFEFQLTPGANNGLGIHYPGKGDAAYTGMELQILDNSAEKYKNELRDNQFHGSLYALVAANRGALKPVGEWNFQRVTVRGELVSVELNGQTILLEDLGRVSAANPDHQGVKRRKGFISLCGHGSTVHWREMRIIEIPFGERKEEKWYQAAGEKDENLAELGFKDLLASGDLSQWVVAPGNEKHWTLQDGWMISYDGKSMLEDKMARHLWGKEEFGDFELVCDWRFPEQERLRRKDQPVLLPNGLEMLGPDQEKVTHNIQQLDSGIFLRGSNRTQVNIWNWSVGSGEVYGVRKATEDLFQKAVVTPRVKGDRPLGEWNRFVIEMSGDKLTVVLNGETVLYQAELPKVPTKGVLALQHHGYAIDFANLWIREK